MAREYLKDLDFLKTIDEMRIKEHFINLQIMNFQEKPIRQIQGIATAGSITVNGSSAVRRTLSLTMVAPENENDLSNLDNIISANKKVKVEVGIQNHLSKYSYYGDMLWFPAGVYLITEATSSTTANTATISIKAKDKMCLLDGSCGGVLPATVTFHEAQVAINEDEYTIEQIPIFTIVKECIRHYGQEEEQNIIINDLDLVAKQSVKYNGSIPIWFTDDYQSFIFSEEQPSGEYSSYTKKFIFGQDIGYMETDFTFPGELVFEAGQTVTEVLDKIIQTLGNYEYFYDLDGHFVFQEKKNYLNNYYTPIMELNDYYYIKAFSDSKYYTTFENAKDAVSFYQSPKYDNIKNDFVVWGSSTSATGVTRNIKYHVAVDEKPIEFDLADAFMYEVKNGNGEHLYYLFEQEEGKYFDDPEAKPIEIEYDVNNVNEEEILENLALYLEENWVQYASSESSFILYFKVAWNSQIRYYYAKIQNHKLIELLYLEDYTVKINKESIVLGIYIPPSQEEDEGGEHNQLIPTPDSDIEGADGKDDYDDSVDAEESKEETEEELGYFTALKIISVDQSDSTYYNSIGFYNEEKQWNELYKLNDKKEVSIKDFNTIVENIAKQYVVRIFVFENFDEENKNSLSIIDTQNILSRYSSANPQELIFDDGSKTELYYQFNDIIVNDEIKFTANKRKQLITELAEIYFKDYNDLVYDIQSVYKATNTEDLQPEEEEEKEDNGDNEETQSYSGGIVPIENSKEQDDEESKNPILPWLGDNPSIKFLQISTDQANLIYEYKQTYYSSDDLIKEISDYSQNNVLSSISVNNDYILTVITDMPVDEPDFDYSQNFYYTLIGRPCYEWREQLYRQALLNQESAGDTGYYDEELLAFWRNNFDTMNEEWNADWEKKQKSLEKEIALALKSYEEEYFSENPRKEILQQYQNYIEQKENELYTIKFGNNYSWKGWNPAIYEDPGLLTFWLDFIDNEQLVSKYSVNQIGRRTKAIAKENINMLYKLEVPDVIFFENTGENDIAEKVNDYKNYGQKYCALKSDQMRYFSSSGTGNTAFDLIREMLYTYLYYNISVNITCVPKYYLEPNNLIYIDDSKSNIQGDYIITQFTIPLTYNGNMTITANQTLVRV